MKSKPKHGIGNKILRALLGVSLVSLGLFAYTVFVGMKDLGQCALEKSLSLGENAVEDSIKSLENQAEKNLLKLVEDQAALSSTLFEKVETEVKIVGGFAAYLWKTPAVRGTLKSYSQNEKPDNIKEHSVYTLAPGVDEESVRGDIDLSGNMDKAFMIICENDPNINTVCMGTETGVFRSYPWRTGRAASYDYRERHWYKKAADKKEVIWTEPYIHVATKDLIVTCAVPFYGMDNKLLGVVEIDMTLKVMCEDILSTQIGEEGYAVLLDKHGNIVARPGLDAGDTRWDEVYTTENLLSDSDPKFKSIIKSMISGKKGIGRAKFEGEEKYIAYAPIMNMEWSLGLVMPVKEIISPAMNAQSKIISTADDVNREINRHIRSIEGTILIIFILTILAVVGLAYRLSRKITRPILDLDRGIKVVGKGDLDYRFQVNTGDEIEDLAEGFNKMTGDLKTHIKILTETTVKKEKIEKELKIAHDIQMDMVPKDFPKNQEVDVYAILDPAKEVGGDLYDFFFIDEDNLCFVVGDVSGKGVPAALLMTMTIALIRTMAREVKSPEKVMTHINKAICRDSQSAMFVTIFYGILNIVTGEVLYVNAGHNPPMLLRRNKEYGPLKNTSGTVMGEFEDAVFKDEKIDLGRGDTLVMYTDGVTEALSSEGCQYSEESLMKEICLLTAAGAHEMVEDIREKVKIFSRGAEQSDDITLMVLKYFGRV